MTRYLIPGALATAIVLVLGQPAESRRDVQDPAPVALSAVESQTTWLVQAATVEDAVRAVEAVGGTVTDRLAVINAVAAQVTAEQRAALSGVRLYENGDVAVSSLAGAFASFSDRGLGRFIENTPNGSWSLLPEGLSRAIDARYGVNFDLTLSRTDGGGTPTLTLAATATAGSKVDAAGADLFTDLGSGVAATSNGTQTSLFSVDPLAIRNNASHNPSFLDANLLHDAGVTGAGVAVAVVDTGVWQDSAKNGVNSRVVVEVDTLGPTTVVQPSLDDKNGHGSHVASSMLSDELWNGQYEGIAPGAGLVSI
ncbi:MAG: S8 family serine peptidase, partial [Pseudomonadota bacterium]